MGEYIYERDYRDPIAPEFFKHEIVEIDIDNRAVITRDHSLGGKMGTLRGFSTVNELAKEGIKL